MTGEGQSTEVPRDEHDRPTRGHGASRRFWSIHPGKAASEWDSFKELSHFGVSWDLRYDLDLLDHNSQQELRDWLAETQHIGKGRAVALASQLWSFYHEMQLGDLVCAAGQNQLLGWGEVIGKYDFATDGRWPEHRRRVEWGSVESRSIQQFSKALQNKLTHRRTLVSVTPELFAEIERAG